jgi:ribonuclease H / adenosylcobalamin/alpha-ribazole phosphatase
MVEEDIYEMYFDGCSKGNPGLSGAGAVIYKNGQEIWSNSYFVSDNSTNNVAEYFGLIKGLKRAIKMNITRLIVKGDSQLIIKQMLGEYQVKSQNMVEMYEIAKKMEEKFESITYHHVYRKYNKRADQLSNDGINIDI